MGGPSLLDKALADMPSELVELIFSYLSVADIHRLRVAGVGATLSTTLDLIRFIQRRRIRSLQRVLHDTEAFDILAVISDSLTIKQQRDHRHRTAGSASSGDSMQSVHLGEEQQQHTQPQHQQHQNQQPDNQQIRSQIPLLSVSSSLLPSPLLASLPLPSTVADFGVKGEKLLVKRILSFTADAIARELLCLRELTIDLRAFKNGNSRPSSLLSSIPSSQHLSSSPLSSLPPPSVSTLPFLPTELARCTQLRKLRLYNIIGMKKLPDCILGLRNLQVLDLDNLPDLVELPSDMGQQLSRLCFLDMERTGLSHIPQSLLQTIERNFSDSNPVKCSSMPNAVQHGIRSGGNRFARGYWVQTLCDGSFPMLGRLADKYGAYMSYFDQWLAEVGMEAPEFGIT